MHVPFWAIHSFLRSIHCLHMRLNFPTCREFRIILGYSMCCDIGTFILPYIYLYTVDCSYLHVQPGFCHFVRLPSTLRWSDSAQTHTVDLEIFCVINFTDNIWIVSMLIATWHRPSFDTPMHNFTWALRTNYAHAQTVDGYQALFLLNRPLNKVTREEAHRV